MSTRKLKIYYAHSHHTYQKHPVIRIAGKYLSDVGFLIGDKIEVTIEAHQITITKSNVAMLPSETESGSAEAQL